MTFERGSWRLRSKRKSAPADYRTGLTNKKDAERAAREWLASRPADPVVCRKGGGNLEALVGIYLAAPKRAKARVAEDNVGRLRKLCRLTFGRELAAITCREVGPEFWQRHQRAALERAGRAFNLSTRYRENIAINAAQRAARSIFLKILLPTYRKAGLDVHDNAGDAMTLPEPEIKPTKVDDGALVEAWRTLEVGSRLWLAVGLARFAGLRREEISACRVGWLEERHGALSIFVADRPEESWWTKTGKSRYAPITDPVLSEWLAALRSQPPDTLVVPDPPDGRNRDHWFRFKPQEWARACGVTARQPLHRLRGLYADHIAQITRDAVEVKLAAVRAAQKSLGHTTSAVTEKHYLSV